MVFGVLEVENSRCVRRSVSHFGALVIRIGHSDRCGMVANSRRAGGYGDGGG